MLVILQLLARADGQPEAHAGRFLVDYDPHLHNRYWRPSIVTTGRLAEARTFPSAEAALELWRTVSRTVPVRPWDGKPNRPLTFYTVALVELGADGQPADPHGLAAVRRTVIGDWQ